MGRELNDATLRALKPPASGRVELTDGRTPGLVFRLTSTGVATWALRSRTAEGRATRIHLGNWPKVGIKAARDAAEALRVAVRQGKDPVAERRAAKAAKLAGEEQAATEEGETVAARLAEWRAVRAADPSSPWSPRYAAEVARVCEKAILPRLGAKLLRETKREDWTALIRDRKREAATPKPKPKKGEKGKAGAPPRDGSGAAAFLYRTVAAFTNFAEAQGWIDLPMLPRKGAGVIAPPPPARARVLTDAELKAIWHAADREPPKLRAFVRLLMLTAARELEVADLVAGEVDLEAARWRLPGARTKNRQPYTLPLSPLALGELRAVWPNHAPEPGEFILGRTSANGFRGFGRLKLRVDKASGVSGWRWHDLRRTARTAMTRLGVPRDHAEAAINHVSGRSKLERTYDRHDFGPEVIAALALWQGHVAGLVGAAAEVVMLPARRGRAG
jgi:integrase